METIQIVLDQELLDATDKAARETKQNRSALVRDALRGHLHKLEIRRLEELEIQGYLKHPADPDELKIWETVQVWPEE